MLSLPTIHNSNHSFRMLIVKARFGLVFEKSKTSESLTANHTCRASCNVAERMQVMGITLLSLASRDADLHPSCSKTPR